jgi:hypothetical protein
MFGSPSSGLVRDAPSRPRGAIGRGRSRRSGTPPQTALATCAKLKGGKRTTCVAAAKRADELRNALAVCRHAKPKQRTACVTLAHKRYDPVERGR